MSERYTGDIIEKLKSGLLYVAPPVIGAMLTAEVLVSGHFSEIHNQTAHEITSSMEDEQSASVCISSIVKDNSDTMVIKTSTISEAILEAKKQGGQKIVISIPELYDISKEHIDITGLDVTISSSKTSKKSTLIMPGITTDTNPDLSPLEKAYFYSDENSILTFSGVNIADGDYIKVFPMYNIDDATEDPAFKKGHRLVAFCPDGNMSVILNNVKAQNSTTLGFDGISDLNVSNCEVRSIEARSSHTEGDYGDYTIQSSKIKQLFLGTVNTNVVIDCSQIKDAELHDNSIHYGAYDMPTKYKLSNSDISKLGIHDFGAKITNYITTSRIGDLVMWTGGISATIVDNILSDGANLEVNSSVITGQIPPHTTGTFTDCEFPHGEYTFSNKEIPSGLSLNNCKGVPVNIGEMTPPEEKVSSEERT